MRGIILRHDHDARGILVQPMHNARPQLAIDAGQIPAVRHERIHERPARNAGRRMHHHAARLVHDDDVVILIKDIQGKHLRQDLDRNRIGQRKNDLFASRQLIVGLLRLAIDESLAGRNNFLDM